MAIGLPHNRRIVGNFVWPCDRVVLSTKGNVIANIEMQMCTRYAIWVTSCCIGVGYSLTCVTLPVTRPKFSK